MLLLDKTSFFPASVLSDKSSQSLMDTFWSMPISTGEDESMLPLSSINSPYSNWGFISPPPTYNFSFDLKSLDLVYDDPFFLNFSSSPSDFSHPKLEPLKIYSPKPVFAYTTVHFDLARSFTPDVLEYTRPKPSRTTASRKRPRAVSSDVDDDRISTKRPRTDDHVSGTRFAKMEAVRNLHAISSSRTLGILSSRRRN